MFNYLLVSGITTGALYALVALGIVVVYKASRVINLAHGELFMVCGFLAFTFHVIWGVPYLAALFAAVVCGFAIGMLTYGVAFRPVLRQGLVSVLLATVGFSFILKGAARNLWGGRGDFIPFPPIVDPTPILVGNVMILPQQLIALAGAVIVMLLFAVFFKYTPIGKWMQATADNVKAATLVGIRVDRIYMLTFATGAAVAAAAAVLMAPLTLLYPDIGFVLFLKAFAAAVLGGLTSIVGAVVGGLLVGVIESLASGYIHTAFYDVSAFIVIMGALIFLPNGIFGGRGVRRV